jgi:CRISPR-associated protein Cas8a1/Csx13
MAKKVKAATEFKLPNPLEYRLSNPNYTIYHRAALGGLAATVRAWGDDLPDGISATIERDRVLLEWKTDLSDQGFLRRLIDASFKLSDTSMVELPGQRIGPDREDLQLAIHNGITATFLQHPKMRPGEKEARRFELRTADHEIGSFFTYKAMDRYAHQRAQKTGLLEDKLNGRLPPIAAIQQWTVPGATGGAADLGAPTDEVILLMFLMVGSAIFLLRPRSYQEKAQSCVIVPDVIDLLAFARAIERVASAGQGLKRFSNTYLNRVVGGAEEAALRFLIDLQAKEVSSERSVSGCIVIAMGKVAWDTNQINRSMIAKVKGDYQELDVFRAAYQHLGNTKIIKGKKGDDYAVPASPVPELVAANLAAERHWCANFRALVSEKKDFQRMLFDRGGLKAMKESVKDADDQAVIRAFQEAWKYKMGALGERARNEGLDFSRLVEVERERTRNDILRTKTSEMLASWFMRFCADATRGSSLATLRQNSESLRKFIFNSRNFERFQNLCLFALVSYTGEEARSATGGAN